MAGVVAEADDEVAERTIGEGVRDEREELLLAAAVAKGQLQTARTACDALT